jgi:hypothetical protein
MKSLCRWVAAFMACCCLSQAATTNLVEPPAMPNRSATKPNVPFPGETIILHDGKIQFTLYLPESWKTPTNVEVPLTIHFHGADWFVIGEHLRHGLSTPLVVAQLGGASGAYRVPFEDRDRLNRWMRMVVETLQKRGAPANTRITTVDISSFSAGYGAVRELLRSPEYLKLIRRIVLSDSIYGSLEGGATPALPHRVAAESIEPWASFVKAAARGEKTFVLTHSQVETSYASSGECAAALIQVVNSPIQKITPGSTVASRDPDFPLQYRSDLGNFHVWGYGGTNGAAHLTHLRHLADVWMAVDAR